MAKITSRAADIIKNWIRTRYTIEFLGTWEMIHNPVFKVVEFDHFGMQEGLPNILTSSTFGRFDTSKNSSFREPSLKIGRELSRQLNVDPAVGLEV